MAASEQQVVILSTGSVEYNAAEDSATAHPGRITAVGLTEAWDVGFEAGYQHAGVYTNGNNGAPDPPPNPYIRQDGKQ